MDKHLHANIDALNYYLDKLDMKGLWRTIAKAIERGIADVTETDGRKKQQLSGHGMPNVAPRVCSWRAARERPALLVAHRQPPGMCPAARGMRWVTRAARVDRAQLVCVHLQRGELVGVAKVGCAVQGVIEPLYADHDAQHVFFKFGGCLCGRALLEVNDVGHQDAGVGGLYTIAVELRKVVLLDFAHGEVGKAVANTVGVVEGSEIGVEKA